VRIVQYETTTWNGEPAICEMADRMEITEDHVTILHTQVVVYEDGPECPCCGRRASGVRRPRGWCAGPVRTRAGSCARMRIAGPVDRR